jgi:hypothetical protein
MQNLSMVEGPVSAAASVAVLGCEASAGGAGAGLVSTGGAGAGLVSTGGAGAGAGAAGAGAGGAGVSTGGAGPWINA